MGMSSLLHRLPSTDNLTLTMKSNLFILTCIALVSVFIAACDAMVAEDDPIAPRPLSESEQQIVEADNNFGLLLFDAINSQAPDENLFISPTSVSMALGMTLNGANGDTREEMVEVLRKKSLTEESINESYQSLVRLLTGLDQEIALNIANSIWYKDGVDIEAPFLEKGETYFNAEVASLDFSNPESVNTINNWVEDNTNGLIKTIIEEISQNTIMYLINAIYFKGNWTYQFDPDLTEQAPFHNLSGGTASVDMMAQRGVFPYFKSDKATFIDLPYGDSLFTMSIIMPDDAEEIGSLIGELKDGLYTAAESQFEHTEVDLFLPRFKLAYETKMKDILRSLGMEQAFQESTADFTRIHRNGGLYISEVVHKSFVEVNEEGTEAAAVTAVIIETTSIAPPPPVVRVDKPFIFLIREKSTGTILFAGKIIEL